MPLYEYRCKECQHRVELLHDYDSTEELTCDRDGGLLIRQFPLSSFRITRSDLEWFGTPEYADASAKRAGVEH